MRKLFASAVAAMTTIVAVSAAPAAAHAGAPSWPVLSSGANGANVVTAQFLLRHHGQTLTVDGAYGGDTKTAVTAFQTAHDLPGDGVVGPDTWTALAVSLQPGSANNAVRALQTALNKHGYALAVDGQFESDTRSAVDDFKTRNFLGAGSTVGSTTWQHLVGGGAGGGGSYRLPVDRSALPRSEYDDPHHDYPAIDLPLSTGVTTYAMASGTVVHVGAGCGLGVGINADDGAYYQFCHFSTRSVSAGQRINAGQVIGAVGSTGNSTGPHLHIEIRVGGANRCPQPMLLALYDGAAVPAPASLPASGCTSVVRAPTGRPDEIGRP